MTFNAAVAHCERWPGGKWCFFPKGFFFSCDMQPSLKSRVLAFFFLWGWLILVDPFWCPSFWEAKCQMLEMDVLRTGHWRDALFVAATALPKDLEADSGLHFVGSVMKVMDLEVTCYPRGGRGPKNAPESWHVRNWDCVGAFPNVLAAWKDAVSSALHSLIFGNSPRA